MATNSNSSETETILPKQCVICKKSTDLSCQRCKDFSEDLLAGIPNRRTVVVPYYCSKEHQKEHWNKAHKKVCHYSRLDRARTKPRKSVDFLHQAVSEDLLPWHPQVRIDYGFNNCKSQSDESQLLGLYIGLLKFLDCDLDELHDACMAGKLAEFIKNAFMTVLPDPQTQGGYFPWFLKNEHIVNNPYPLT